MITRNYYIAFIALFFVIITAPFVRMATPVLSNKEQASYLCSVIKMKSTNALNDYIADNYGFRGIMTKIYIDIYLKILKESPIPRQVVLGKDDWFFLGDEYNQSYSAAIGVYRFPDEILDETVCNILKIKSYCDSVGTEFYLVVAPDKNAIYPEHLEEIPNSNIRFRQLLVESLKNKLNVIDLYSYIKIQKEKDLNKLIYYKTDSHWNNYGGYLASKFVTDQIAGQVDITPLDDDCITISKIKRETGNDLAQILKIHTEDTDFNIVDNREIELVVTIEENPRLSKREVLFVNNNTISTKAKAIIFKDSFFTAMKTPFLSTIKEAIVFHQYQFDVNVVNTMISQHGKPDFIVFEVVERNLSEILYK